MVPAIAGRQDVATWVSGALHRDRRPRSERPLHSVGSRGAWLSRVRTDADSSRRASTQRAPVYIDTLRDRGLEPPKQPLLAVEVRAYSTIDGCWVSGSTATTAGSFLGGLRSTVRLRVLLRAAIADDSRGVGARRQPSSCGYLSRT